MSEVDKKVAEKKEVTKTADTEIEVSKEVMDELGSVIEKTVEKTVADQVTKAFEKVEKTVEKNLGSESEKKETVYRSFLKGGMPLEEMTAQQRFGFGVKSLMAGDMSNLIKHNEFSINAQIKAGYQNETTNADGGYLVPDPDFIAEVTRLEEQYGVAVRNARLWDTNSDSVKMNKKATGVTMYETGEQVQKTGTKMTFGQDLVALRKFAAIASVTDELDEDAAVNIWNELTMDFAREKARIEDVLVFTDPTTGIINTSGVAAISVGNAITDMTFDHLNQAVYSVPTESMNGGKFYLNRKILGVVQRLKDQNDNYIWLPGPNGSVTGTIWGYPYELVEVLHGTDTANDGFIVFGNLKYSTLIRKRGLQLTMGTEGTVHDSDGNAKNLFEQDMKALRAVTRMNNVVQIPAAFCVIGTGTVS
ncbi:phage major capsid protein [Polynucleobacter sp.]|uniref:phage major capsid protein n=1 Tax=Polynucleobacter sp. TaxID=2029855 RepID=UPI003F69522A